MFKDWGKSSKIDKPLRELLKSNQISCRLFGVMGIFIPGKTINGNSAGR
jgi:hypothetical protein